jgi:serine acetyltransferase
LKVGGDGTSLDIGAGPGLPVIGDNVQFGVDVMILGPFKIGDNCWLYSRASIFKDIPEGSMVAGTPARVIGQTTPGSNMYERK